MIVTETPVKIELPPERELSEEEVAAAIACALYVMRKKGRKVGREDRSAWGRASILEGCLKTKVDRSTMSGVSNWRLASLPVTVFVLLILFSSSAWVPSFAQSLARADVRAMPPSDLTDRKSLAEVVPSRSGTLLRVLLSTAPGGFDIATPDGARVIDMTGGKVVSTLLPQSRWHVKWTRSEIALDGTGGGDVAFKPGKLVCMGDLVQKVSFAGMPLANAASRLSFKVPPAPPQSAASQKGRDATRVSSITPGYLILPVESEEKDRVFAINQRLYRGALLLSPQNTPDGVALRAVNIVDLEDYLLSVVPSEMPSSWPIEALKAQAVAARSYAVANTNKHWADGYDVKDNTEDQVYLGVSCESDSGNRACAETEGLVLKHGARVVSAFFHSTSGGSTEAAEMVWQRDVPYTQSVVDYDDASPHFQWLRRLTVADVDRVLKSECGNVLAIVPFDRSPSSRIRRALLTGSLGSKIVTGEKLRQFFKLPSSNFNVSYEDGAYVFAGRGFGHGLGMSQWGAKALAEGGYNAGQILTYYYRNVAVDYLLSSPAI